MPTTSTTSTNDVSADTELAKRFIFYAFVISILLLQLAYTYILYRSHQVFLSAVNTEFLCGKKMVLERDTARWQLRRRYLNPTQEEIDSDLTRYNNWRLWVICFPTIIAGVIFMMIKYGVSTISPLFYGMLSVLGLYLGFYQMYELPSQYGFPSFWSLNAFQYGKIQQLTEFHTQAYNQLYELFNIRLDKCLDDSAEYNCMELIPNALKEKLVRRYVSVQPESNIYQATQFFEEALKKKNYDVVIGYMRLTDDSDDLRDLIGGVETGGDVEEQITNINSRLTLNIVTDIQALYVKSFWLMLVIGWGLLFYFLWFHRFFSGGKVEAYVAGPTYTFWLIIAVGWCFHYFIL